MRRDRDSSRHWRAADAVELLEEAREDATESMSGGFEKYGTTNYTYVWMGDD